MSGGKKSYEATISIAVVVVLCGCGLYYGLRAINEAKRFQTAQTLREIGRLIENSIIHGSASFTAAEVANTMGWRLCRKRVEEECVSATRIKWKNRVAWRMCLKYQCFYMLEDGNLIWSSRMDLGEGGYIGKGVRDSEEESFRYSWSN